MKTCIHKFGSGELCAEEVWKTSDYCILHTDFPKDKHSPEFNVLIEEKNREIEKKFKKMDFNFEGARLFNLDFSKMEINDDLHFMDVNIRENVSFENARIEGKTDFLRAIIGGDANFQDSEFVGDVNFEKTMFNGDVNLTQTVIGGTAIFTEAVIRGKANFYLAEIVENIDFGKAEINGDAHFTRSNIGGDVNFPLARITGDVNFPLAKINGDANFLLAAIHGNVDFRLKMDGTADFEKVKIDGDADFEEADIGRDVNFSRSIIAGNNNFFMASIGGDAYFTGSTFVGKANFEQTFVNGDFDFREVEFRGDTNFEKAKITGSTKFKWSSFSGYAYYSNSEFKGPITFDDASILTKGVFKGLRNFNASFEGAILKNVAFRDCDLTNVRFKHVIFEHCGLSTSFWYDSIPEHRDYEQKKILNANRYLIILSHFLKILWISNLMNDANIAADSYNRIKKSLKEEGDYEKAGKFYIKEMDLKREVYWIDNKLMWLFLSVLSITTNYGESIRRLVFSYFGLIMIFSILYMFIYGYPIYQAIIYSALNSVALIYTPTQSTGLELLIFAENLGGTVLIALFVYVFAMKMSR